MSWIGSGSRRTKVCFHGAVRALTSALLCSLLVETPIFAELPPPSPKDPTDTRPGQLQGEQRILHALNRLTFGPRPGEVAEVDRIGLKRWFEMQLNPQTIDDSALNTRLSAYPAMFLPQAELIERYPSAETPQDHRSRGAAAPRPGRARHLRRQHRPLPGRQGPQVRRCTGSLDATLGGTLTQIRTRSDREDSPQASVRGPPGRYGRS